MGFVQVENQWVYGHNLESHNYQSMFDIVPHKYTWVMFTKRTIKRNDHSVVWNTEFKTWHYVNHILILILQKWVLKNKITLYKESCSISSICKKSDNNNKNTITYILLYNVLPCVVGVWRGRKEERRVHETREDRTREDRGRGRFSLPRSFWLSSISTACNAGYLMFRLIPLLLKFTYILKFCLQKLVANSLLP